MAVCCGRRLNSSFLFFWLAPLLKLFCGFFLSLRWSSHNIKLTILKWTSQGHLVYSQYFATTTSNSKIFSSSPNRSLYPRSSVSWFSPSLPRSWQPPVFSFLWIYLLLLTELCLLPSNFICWSPNTSSDCIWNRAFAEVNRVKWSQKNEALDLTELVPLKKDKKTTELSLPCEGEVRRWPSVS